MLETFCSWSYKVAENFYTIKTQKERILYYILHIVSLKKFEFFVSNIKVVNRTFPILYFIHLPIAFGKKLAVFSLHQCFIPKIVMENSLIRFVWTNLETVTDYKQRNSVFRSSVSCDNVSML